MDVSKGLLAVPFRDRAPWSKFIIQAKHTNDPVGVAPTGDSRRTRRVRRDTSHQGFEREGRGTTTPVHESQTLGGCRRECPHPVQNVPIERALNFRVEGNPLDHWPASRPSAILSPTLRPTRSKCWYATTRARERQLPSHTLRCPQNELNNLSDRYFCHATGIGAVFRTEIQLIANVRQHCR